MLTKTGVCVRADALRCNAIGVTRSGPQGHELQASETWVSRLGRLQRGCQQLRELEKRQRKVR
eukprot:1192235-Prorocentrum_minimum.AAC.3